MLTLGKLRYQQQKLRPEHAGTLADVFALRWLETEHELPRERALTQVAFSHSLKVGFNAFHLDEARKTLVLFVTNPTKNVSEFATALDALVTNGIASALARSQFDSVDTIDALFDPAVAFAAQEARCIRQLHAVIEESHSLIESINFRLVYFGDPVAAAEAAIVKNFKEDVLHLRHSIEERLGKPDLAITCTVKSADGSSTVPDKLKGFRTSIAMANHVRTDGPDGQIMHVGYVSLKELLETHRKLGIRFLSRNVRAALNASTGSNQALAKAFLEIARGDVPPEVFLFRHNGVTLTAVSCESENGALALVEPQVLNGAQTVTTLQRVCEQLKNQNDYTRAVDARLSKISVIGRVITRSDRDFVTSVTISSNRQNPIMPWHLRAHDDVQSALQAWFSDHLGIYYELLEGAFDSMSEDELGALGIVETDKCIDMRKLAQTFLAVDGQLDKMQQLKTVFEDDTIYGRTFCGGRMKANPEDVVICYKIDRRIGKLLKMLGGSDKYAFVKGARSLIWALLCQAHMNDPKRERFASEHGSHLIATDDFTAALERFASSRVKPLLMWIANESEYREDVRSERYGFMTSRKLFDRSMEVARERWGWSHRRLGSCS
jgi:hypothetical protein